jgi:hypothetical protein
MTDKFRFAEQVIVRSDSEHRGFAPQNPDRADKNGVTIAITPFSYSFEPAIAASKQLPYEVLPEQSFFSFTVCRAGRETRPR